MNFIVAEKIPEMPVGHLFNDPEFHALKDGKRLVYTLENNDENRLQIIFYCLKNQVVSGYLAPFGSFDFFNDPNPGDLDFFIKEITADLLKRGFGKTTIKLPPAYFVHSSMSEQALEKNGFRTAIVDLNQQLVIDSRPFGERIVQKERNKLNRAIDEGYEFILLGSENIPAVFQLISETHGRKNYPVTLSQQDFELAFKRMPANYRLFGLYDNEILIAAVASVKVTEDVMYNFYHADLERYRSRSPLVMLIGEIYQYCYKHDVEILDLGISSVNGIVNQGLYKFKENLGCDVSKKKTMELTL